MKNSHPVKVYSVEPSGRFPASAWGDYRGKETSWHRSKMDDKGISACGKALLNVEDESDAEQIQNSGGHLCGLCFPRPDTSKKAWW